MFPRGARVPMGQFNNMGGLPPFQSFRGNQIPSRGAGGFLSKFFSKQGAVNSFGAQPTGPVTGGFLSNLLTNPSSASGMLNNIQNVINMANQFTPMIQQYGPMVKNIPALINLYREMNSSDDDSETSEKEAVEAKDLPVSKKEKKMKEDQGKEVTSVEKGTSKPKLYI